MITRKLAQWMAILCGFMSGTAAIAQSAPPQPPIRPRIDANNVDLVTGYLQLAPTAMSIGPAGEGGLTYTPLAFLGAGLEEGNDIQYTGTIRVTNWSTYTDYVVTVGTYAEDFAQPNGSQTISTNEGLQSTLTQDSTSFTYTGVDGTVAVFTKGLTVTAAANIMSLTLPDGTARTYHYVTASVCRDSGCTSTYNVTRLQSVTNNRGYQIHFSYYSNASSPLPEGQDGPWTSVSGATGINMAVDFCDPLASTCSGLSQSWPTASVDSSLNVTDPAGEVTKYDLASVQNQYSITLPGSSSPDLVYNVTSTGQVTKVQRAGQANPWTYSYTATSTDLTTVVTDPLNRTSTYDFDATSHALKSYTNNATGEVTSIQNYPSGLPTTINLPSGQSIQYSYDARGNIIETDLIASGQPTLSWTANFDATCVNPKTCNKPNWTKDPQLNETDYVYNPNNGQIAIITLPAPNAQAPRPQTSYIYAPLTAYYKNSSGTIVADGTSIYYPNYIETCRTTSGCSPTSSDELMTVISYGLDGVANNRLPSSSTTQDGTGAFVATRTFQYDAVGNLTTVSGPMAFQSTAMTYDGLRRVTGTVGPSLDGSATYVGVRTTYDSRGLPATVDFGTLPGQTASAWQSFSPKRTLLRQFDAGRRLTQTSLQAGGATYSVRQVSYDDIGRVDCGATRMNLGNIPASACIAAPAGSFGPDRIIKYYYDPGDRVQSVVSGYQSSDPITTQAMTYYPGGALETLTDGNGYMTTYKYDAYGRLQYIDYPDPGMVGRSSTTDYEQFSYDQDSNVTIVQRRSGDQITFIRDALGRVAQMQLPSSWASGAENVYYSYDNQGRLLSALYGSPTGTGITQTYDGLGRLQTRTVFGRQLTYGYDLANRLTQLTYPGTDGFFAKYNYTNEELQSIVDSTGTTLATFTYDTLGTLTQILRPNSANTTYTPDAIERLQGLTQDLSGTTSDYTASFAYNPAGQIVTKTQNNDAAYTWLPSPANATTSSPADKQNQLLAFNGVSVGHDVNSDVTSGINTLSYAYDPIGQLRTATSSGGTVSVDYDPSGMLRREINGGTETDYLYDGGNLVAEYVNGALTGRFVHGPGADNPLVWYQVGTGTKVYLHADERGSIVAASDANGVATGSVKYSSYGEAGGALASPFGYTGQLYLADLQLYYYKARMYSPQSGRFLQPDPTGYGAGMNLYAYAGADPVNLADSSGMDPILPNTQQDCPTVGNQTECAAPSPCFTIECYLGGNGTDAGGVPSAGDVTVTGQRCDLACIESIASNLLQQQLLNDLLNQPIAPPSLPTPSELGLQGTSPQTNLPCFTVGVHTPVSGSDVLLAAGALNDTADALATGIDAFGGDLTGLAGAAGKSAPLIAAPISIGLLAYGRSTGNSEAMFDGGYGLATIGVATLINPVMGTAMGLTKLLADLSNPSTPSILDQTATGPSFTPPSCPRNGGH